MNVGRLAPVAFSVMGLAAIALWLFIAWRQVFFPLELFAHEGAVVDHIRRLLEGKAIYGPPVIEFVPFLYTPGFYLVCAAFAWAGDLAFVVPRAVSAVATVGALICLAELTRRVTGRAVWGVIAAGVFALGASRVHAWYALAQVDSLFLLCLALAVFVGHSARTWRGFFIVGLIFAAAFLCKQIGAVSGLLYAAAIAVTDRRHALAVVAGMACGIVPAVAILTAISDGWFWYYAFEIPASFGIRASSIFVLLRDLAFLAPAFAAGLFVLWRLWSGGEKDLARRVFALVVCLFGTAALGRIHPGGHVNALVPAIWLTGFALAGAVGLLWQGRAAVPVTSRLHLLLLGVMLLQFAVLGYNPKRFLPSPEGAAVLAEIRARLAAAPQPMLLPGTGYLIGKVAGADPMAVNDVLHTDAGLRQSFLAEVETQMRQRRYASVVLEEFLRRRWAVWHEPYYRSEGFLSGNIDAQKPRTGLDFGPPTLLLAR
jgi:hypothetical protein